MPRFNITKAFGSISQPRLSAEYVRINVCMLYMYIYVRETFMYYLTRSFAFYIHY